MAVRAKPTTRFFLEPMSGSLLKVLYFQWINAFLLHRIVTAVAGKPQLLTAEGWPGIRKFRKLLNSQCSLGTWFTRLAFGITAANGEVTSKCMQVVGVVTLPCTAARYNPNSTRSTNADA